MPPSFHSSPKASPGRCSTSVRSPSSRCAGPRRTAPKRDPLLDHILDRHTNRTSFDLTRPVAPSQLETIRAAARNPDLVYVNQALERAEKVQDITQRAWDAWIGYAPTREEVAHWTHVGNAAIAAAPYGPYVSDAALARAAGSVSFETLSDPSSAQFQANRTAYRRTVETGHAHLWIVSPAFDRKGMFEAGRDWVRVHLQARALGLDMQPHSEALQDFQELAADVRELHDALGVAAPARIQMLGRIGHRERVGPSPRLPASAHIGV
ncbi:hypothetical protein L6Q21_16570 [Sandaracinobacter sp. RS1-74]|uniref:hypothetical protein n=1 Tax=Sandaracinobacteroides sayramensis TaxID=2913411 RepID=UPI001EDC25E5|nr:hypothetical protein [Sandaracinobacteroides sayramensis]MCG2842590.1 hypothetical protein [Sandaracinobacteroides sayramensis]